MKWKLKKKKNYVSALESNIEVSFYKIINKDKAQNLTCTCTFDLEEDRPCFLALE